jgi:four helix bundle protein
VVAWQCTEKEKKEKATFLLCGVLTKRQICRIVSWLLNVECWLFTRLLKTKEEEEQLAKQAGFDLGDRLVDFSILITDIVEALPSNRTGNHVSRQLLRSGTSAAPSGESRRDFIHKLKLALKELRETVVWLKIIRRKRLIESTQIVDVALVECDELIAIIVSSIATATKRMRMSGVNN